MAEESPSTFKRVDNFVRGVANAITFGYADKWAGRADAAVLGGTPEERIRQQQELTQKASEDPTYTAGVATGTIVGGAKIVKAFQGLRSMVGLGRTATIAPAVETVATATVEAAGGAPEAKAPKKRFGYKSKAAALAALATATYYALPSIQEFLTRKRPDAAQGPIDQKALEAQQPRVSGMRESLAKGERPGARPLALPPVDADTPKTPEAMARQDLADRKASSRRAADLGAHATLYAAAGEEGRAEVIAKSTWGRYLAATKKDGSRQLVYETGDQAGRRPAIFRGTNGAQVRVEPKREAFVISDQGVLASPTGSKKVEIEVFRVQPDGTPGKKLDTIKIDEFPTGPERRSEVAPPAAKRAPGVAPG